MKFSRYYANNKFYFIDTGQNYEEIQCSLTQVLEGKDGLQDSYSTRKLLCDSVCLI